MRKLVLALLISSAVSTTSNAATFASGSSYDARMQTVMYNPDDVVKVRVKPGTVSVVQVSSDEKIEDVGLGDPGAWNVSVRNNIIFFRPASEDNPDTNVVVVTDKRAYTLFLTSVKTNPTFVLKFEYPKPKPILFDNNKIPCTDGGVVNGRYQVQGDESVKPNKIWDDGRFTCFTWENSKTMPVVYRVDSDGNENLVNNSMEKNVMVVHDVSPEFLLRNGNQVMRVKTSSVVKRLYDKKGTTTGQIRTEKITDE
ncbi:conjugal transfer protein TraH [Citrobacter sp. NCU1]|uniref:TrbG/VirB9 family P-type conjugative transfer protein n=1 Tax=Citrobacter sp. NCU1 TaxID=2026683 RepID=UPI001390E80F|nr:TrbG/VirB9 family P-type conjugative transfer protein [Citrobacter sp. NCU1]NDO82809.1 conjugal transfer protein TraH [Citrobacter sp. NCU1]